MYNKFFKKNQVVLVTLYFVQDQMYIILLF